MTRLLTIAEFQTRIGLDELSQIAGLGSFNGPEGRSLNQPMIEEAIKFAEDLLTGYARSRYPVIETMTAEATPDLLKGFVSDIARYRLRSRSGGQSQISEEVRKRYEDALSFFKGVSRGQAELPIAGQPINGEMAGRVLAAMPEPVAEKTLKGW